MASPISPESTGLSASEIMISAEFSLKPGAEKFKVDRSGNFVGGRTTLGTGCVPLGIPQTFVTPYPFQIVQKQNFLVMIFEYPNTFRFIPLDGRPHGPDPDPTWMGDAVGRWDGDTLVADLWIWFTDKTEAMRLHVHRRFTCGGAL